MIFQYLYGKKYTNDSRGGAEALRTALKVCMLCMKTKNFLVFSLRLSASAGEDNFMLNNCELSSVGFYVD
jgi:hypothetical protein